MAKYIDAEAAKRAVVEAVVSNMPLVAERLAEIIEDLPAADVELVRHGRWEIVMGSNKKEYMVCSECRKEQDLIGTFAFCPSCGAKMGQE